MNELGTALSPVRHGIAMGLLALILGVCWVAYIATHHEKLHGGFEQAEVQIKQTHEQKEMKAMQSEMSMDQMDMGKSPHSHAAGEAAHHDETSGHAHQGQGHGHGEMHQHSHSGSLATDAMQRLIRGHIHFMGIGLLVILMLGLVASTSLKPCWKSVFAWTFGLGALMYPPAWILMGFRTVELGPEAAEASVMWLFGPGVALLLGSLIALFCVFMLESCGCKKSNLFSWAFEKTEPETTES
ncbi:MAG: hypothetical protein COA61_000520 [Zetaproteobacteria bacterium]|nr:hypothetical protein [Zetaproteobacteria bacterium]